MATCNNKHQLVSCHCSGFINESHTNNSLHFYRKSASNNISVQLETLRDGKLFVNTLHLLVEEIQLGDVKLSMTTNWKQCAKKWLWPVMYYTTASWIK